MNSSADARRNLACSTHREMLGCEALCGEDVLFSDRGNEQRFV